MKGDVNCAKCDANLGFGWDRERFEVQLGCETHPFTTVLCFDCRNRWSEDFYGTKLYLKMMKNKCDSIATEVCYMTTGGSSVGEAALALEQVLQSRIPLAQEAFKVAKEWVADKIPAPQQQATP